MTGITRTLIALACVCVTAMTADAQEEKSEEAVKFAARLDSIETLVKTLDAQIAIAAPKGLTLAQQTNWSRQTEWLQSARGRVVEHLNLARRVLTGGYGASGGVGTPDQSTKVAEMAQMNMQFLALQNAMQNESRKFQTLSNASKTRHDIAMNAIRNLK